jgi:hypothetical protein
MLEAVLWGALAAIVVLVTLLGLADADQAGGIDDRESDFMPSEGYRLERIAKREQPAPVEALEEVNALGGAGY